MRRRFIAITCWIVTKRSKVVLRGVHSQPGAEPWVGDGMPSPTLYNVSSDLHTSVSFSSSYQSIMPTRSIQNPARLKPREVIHATPNSPAS